MVSTTKKLESIAVLQPRHMKAEKDRRYLVHRTRV